MTELERLKQYLHQDLNYSDYAIEQSAMRFKRNPDILAEFCRSIDGAVLDAVIEVAGHTASSLMQQYPDVFKNTYGAYGFLILLREDYYEAKALLKKGFIRK